MNPKEGLRVLARNPWVQRALLTGILLFSSDACTRPQDQTIEFPVLPTATAPATPTKESQIPSMDRQAQEKVLFRMFNSLLSTQYSANGKESLKSTTTNPEIITSSLIQTILERKQLPPDGDLLKIKWVYSAAGWPYGIEKTVGEAEIKNIKLGSLTVDRLTDADRANGIQWKGAVEIKFIDRYRIVKPYFLRKEGPYEQFKDSGSESEWEKATLPQPTHPFTPWEDANFNVLLALVNDQWFFGHPGQIAYPVTPYSVGGNSCHPSYQPPLRGCQVGYMKWE